MASHVLDTYLQGGATHSLRCDLLKRVVGQDQAIEQIVNIYQMHVAGLAAPHKPVGSFLFLGPTGTGKTRTVEAMAAALVNDPRAMIKIDCAEFQHSHEIAKLIGSPPGYLGHRETHAMLSQEMINQHHTDTMKLSFVLFDEIEKASDALWNLLLGILDKATLTLGDNRKVDFSKAMIFMTSNLGAAEMNALVAPKFGLARSLGTSTGLMQADEKTNERMARCALEAARRKFTPEFMNRIDKVVIFKSLGESELRRILDLELAQVQMRIEGSSRPFVLTVSGAAKDHILSQGVDAKYGARYLKRTIERMLVHPICNLMLTGQIAIGNEVTAECDPETRRLFFLKTTEEPRESKIVLEQAAVAGEEPAMLTKLDPLEKRWGELWCQLSETTKQLIEARRDGTAKPAEAPRKVA